MNKERNYNPVQAQRKADKAKAVKKGKSTPSAHLPAGRLRSQPRRRLFKTILCLATHS